MRKSKTVLDSAFPRCGFWISGTVFWILAVDSGFYAVDSGYQELDSEFHAVDSGFLQLDSGFQAVDSRFHAVDSGYRELDSGFHAVDSGFQELDSGFWIPNSMLWIPDFRNWILNSKLWILDSMLWILDFRNWILDYRSWISDSISVKLGFDPHSTRGISDPWAQCSTDSKAQRIPESTSKNFPDSEIRIILIYACRIQFIFYVLKDCAYLELNCRCQYCNYWLDNIILKGGPIHKPYWLPWAPLPHLFSKFNMYILCFLAKWQ